MDKAPIIAEPYSVSALTHLVQPGRNVFLLQFVKLHLQTNLSLELIYQISQSLKDMTKIDILYTCLAWGNTK